MAQHSSCLPTHCEILGSYLQQHNQHHVFRALFSADPLSKTEASKEDRFLYRICWFKLTASGVTSIITSLPAGLVRQESVVVRLICMPGLSCLGDIPYFYFYFVGSLVFGLRLWSCAFIMLLPLGAKALPQTHSEQCVLSQHCNAMHCSGFTVYLRASVIA